MGPNILYIGLAVFMGYFSITLFIEGRTGIAVMFLILASLNLLTVVVKRKAAREQAERENQ